VFQNGTRDCFNLERDVPSRSLAGVSGTTNFCCRRVRHHQLPPPTSADRPSASLASVRHDGPLNRRPWSDVAWAAFEDAQGSYQRGPFVPFVPFFDGHPRLPR